MLQIMTELPDNILAVSGIGKITGDDYESLLIPAVEAKLANFSKLRLLYHLGSEFSGFDAQALWDDTKVGLQHLTNWERIAVVSDVDWLRGATKVFGFIMPCPVKVFSNNELDIAIQWICSED